MKSIRQFIIFRGRMRLQPRGTLLFQRVSGANVSIRVCNELGVLNEIAEGKVEVYEIRWTSNRDRVAEY